MNKGAYIGVYTYICMYRYVAHEWVNGHLNINLYESVCNQL